MDGSWAASMFLDYGDPDKHSLEKLSTPRTKEKKHCREGKVKKRQNPHKHEFMREEIKETELFSGDDTARMTG